MNKLAILITSLFLVDCGALDEANHRTVNVNLCYAPKADSEAEEYVKEFYELADEYKVSCRPVKEVKVVDEDLEIEGNKMVIGICYGNGVIKIERQVFNNYGPAIAKLVTWHELGHCALGLKHAQQEHVNIMTPAVMNSNTIKTNWDLLVSKLFNKDLSLTEGKANE